MDTFFTYSGISGFFNLLRDKKIAITALLYIILSAVILYKFGINTNGEASKYIEDAENIINNQSLRSGIFSVFYIVYSFIISVFIFLSIPLQGLAWIQVLLSLIAASCVYKLIFHITEKRGIGFAAFVVYLICLPIQKWNFFLYTESFHASLVTIGLYFFYCVFQKRQLKRTPIVIIILLLIIFSRPVGMIFLISALMILFIFFLKYYRKRIIYFIGVLFILSILILNSHFTFYFNPDSLRRMEIICQVPTIKSDSNYTEFNTSGLTTYFQVIISEVGIKNFIYNGLKKWGSFFGLVRNFYSIPHNTILFITILSLYPLAIAGIWLQIKRAFYIKLFCLFYISITTIGIFFTCDEWSNRFIAPLFPFIIILAALGFYQIKNKFLSKPFNTE